MVSRTDVRHQSQTLTITPVQVNSFANYYKNRLWRNEVAVKKDMRRKELKVLLVADSCCKIFAFEGADEG